MGNDQSCTNLTCSFEDVCPQSYNPVCDAPTDCIFCPPKLSEKEAAAEAQYQSFVGALFSYAARHEFESGLNSKLASGLLHFCKYRINFFGAREAAVAVNKLKSPLARRSFQDIINKTLKAARDTRHNARSKLTKRLKALEKHQEVLDFFANVEEGEDLKSAVEVDLLPLETMFSYNDPFNVVAKSAATITDKGQPKPPISLASKDLLSQQRKVLAAKQLNDTAAVLDAAAAQAREEEKSSTAASEKKDQLEQRVKTMIKDITDENPATRTALEAELDKLVDQPTTEHANALIKMLNSKFNEGIIQSGTARQDLIHEFVEANNQLKKARDASSATPTIDKEAWKQARETDIPNFITYLKDKNDPIGTEIEAFWKKCPVSQGGQTKDNEDGKSVVHAVSEFVELLLTKRENVNDDDSKDQLEQLLDTLSPLMPKAQQFTYTAGRIKDKLLETVIPRNPSTTPAKAAANSTVAKFEELNNEGKKITDLTTTVFTAIEALKDNKMRESANKLQEACKNRIANLNKQLKNIDDATSHMFKLVEKLNEQVERCGVQGLLQEPAQDNS